MFTRCLRLAVLLCLFGILRLYATVFYVDMNCTNPVPPFSSWATAATNIQDAVDAATNYDEVLVTNGIYQYGGRFAGFGPTNRVWVIPSVLVQSVNGPAVTIIQGYNNSGIYPDPAAVRCAFLGSGAQLIGFTLTNGGTPGELNGDENSDGGGGVFCMGGIVSNCVITGNTAFWGGGGACYATLFNCTLAGNSCSVSAGPYGFGGGAVDCTLSNCVIISNTVPASRFSAGGGTYDCTLTGCFVAWNSASVGGGTYAGTLTNCTVVSNTANYGGGVYEVKIGQTPKIVNQCTLAWNFATNSGGGAYSGLLTNCLIISNSSGGFGGGAIQSILNNCKIAANLAMYSGGGTYSCSANNSAFVGNTSMGYGGGAAGGDYNNCTFFSNSADEGGGVVGSMNNCILYNNISTNGPNYFQSTLNFCCTTPLPPGIGNITNDPLFVNIAGGDFHLSSNSPCINSGNNAYVVGTTDLDGNPRIVGGTVDIGAYEFQNPASIISYAWLEQYGFATDGSADFTDTDGSGMNHWQDWVAGLDPTNPSSVLKMAGATNSGTNIVVTWQSVTNITYFLQRATNLSEQPAFQPLASNVVGQAGMTSYTDTNAPAPGPYFYRVGVQ
jgi:hypothetical protein